MKQGHTQTQAPLLWAPLGKQGAQELQGAEHFGIGMAGVLAPRAACVCNSGNSHDVDGEGFGFQMLRALPRTRLEGSKSSCGPRSEFLWKV